MTELFDTEALNPSLKTVSQADLDHYAPRTIEDLNERLPQYEFIELIAVGGMGAVYKARQPKLDRLIAIKLLPKMDHDEYGFGDRFEQEAKAMAKLSHPHIVPIFDFGETKGGQAYFVMEFIEGADMFQLICGGQLTLAHFFGWIPQVCSAIQYAHKRDIVHRDIKPANILIDKEGNVKMADFGLARLTGAKPTWDPDDDSETEVNEDAISMGTPGYAAPEQFNKDTQVDGRADIYALGVVMYQMLTGRMPKGAFPMPSECNPHIDIRLDEVVLRAMQEDADDRFQTIAEISERLAAIHATKNGMPEKEAEKKQEPEIDSDITPSGKRLITGPVRVKSKSAPLATGRVSTLTGKINIPADRVAAGGKTPTLVTGRVATLPANNSGSRPSTELRRSIDRRNSSLPPYVIPLIIVAVSLIIFALVKFRKTPEENTPISQQQLMDGIAASVTTKNTKSRLADKGFVFIKKIPSFNQDGATLAVMRRDGKKLNASGITQLPEELKAIHSLKISGTHVKNSKPFALALHDDGTLSAWGDNSHKQLEIPEAASANVIQIAVGVDHALALTQKGKVIAWGRNTTAQCNIPKGLGKVIAIAAGNFHSLALTAEGKVIPWGKGSLKKIPTRLRGKDFTVTAISEGSFHSYALTNDETLIGWGVNGAEQLDQPNLSKVVSVACSDQASYALSKNGEVTGWGIGIRKRVTPGQKITHIEAFPNALAMQNENGQWLFYGAYQKETTPIAAPSAEMKYFLSPLFVFAWPSSPMQGAAHNNAPANNAPRPISPPSPNPNTETGQRIAEIESESKTTYTTQFKQPFDTAIDKLNSFYTQALDSAKDEVKNTGASAAYQNEIKRINNGGPLQAPGDSDLPENLHSMRNTYLEKLNSYKQDILKNRLSHEQALDSKLEKLQLELSNAQKSAAALEVEKFRQQRRQWLAAEKKQL